MKDQIGHKLRQLILRRFINLYPPFLGAGVKVRYLDDHLREIRVSMKLTPLNKNYMGTQFGGSLYAMTDPFFALIVMENLGSEYVVWDKAASIRFKRPGRGEVSVDFKVSDEELRAIRLEADEKGRAYPTKTFRILAEDGSLVAEVDKTLSVKRKS